MATKVTWVRLDEAKAFVRRSEYVLPPTQLRPATMERWGKQARDLLVNGYLLTPKALAYGPFKIADALVYLAVFDLNPLEPGYITYRRYYCGRANELAEAQSA